MGRHRASALLAAPLAIGLILSASPAVGVATPGGASTSQVGAVPAGDGQDSHFGAPAAAGVGPSEESLSTAGFEDTVALSGLVGPTAVRFSPDGRVFVAESRGTIMVFDGLDDTTPTMVVDLREQVHHYWDRGLLGFNLDPAFPTSPYLYVLYSRDAEIGGVAPRWGDTCPSPPGPLVNGCVISGRLSRLELDGDTWVGEQVLVDDWCQQYPSHSMGDIEFGPDGSLYASAGEGAALTFYDYGQAGSPLNPCGDPPSGRGGLQVPPTAEGGSLRAQDARTPGDPQALNGTVIRVDRATGQGVGTNPWSSSPDANRRRVVAYGLRNPFRMAVEPGTDEVWVGDVGLVTAEEVDRIADPGGAAENFGWPCYEGAGPMVGFRAIGLDLCDDLYAEQGAVTPPTFSYAQDAPVVPGESCPTGTSSLTGVAFYEGGAYPEGFDGAMIVADYARKCIWAFPREGQPVTLMERAHNPVDVQIGPGGDIFYPDFLYGTIHRITWTGNPPPYQQSYLSDMAWSSAENGRGPAERDMSNGGDEPGDGGPLTINNSVYAKGIGVHARSEVSVTVADKCSRFEAVIGVDDEVGAGGSVMFTVRGDGQELYASAVLTGARAAQVVDVDLSGVEELTLSLSDGGDGTSGDSGDWADAKLTCERGPDYLSNRTPVSASNGSGPVEVDRSNGGPAGGDGGRLSLDGVGYDKGLGVHARSEVVYSLASSCTAFRADIGLDDEADPDGSVVFKVRGDGALIYESTPMAAGSATRHLDLDVGGVDRLSLVVAGAGDGTSGDHADWADAQVDCDAPSGTARAHIDTPTAHTHWRVGDTIGFSGGAEDSSGAPLPPSALTWSLVIQHCPESCHPHVIESFNGVASGSFVAPDHSYPSHLELRLTAALGDGGQVERRIDLDPRTVDLRFESDPEGVPLAVGATTADTPFDQTVLVGSVVTVTAPDTVPLTRGTAYFEAWSDGGERTHTIEAAEAPLTLRATYRIDTAPGVVSGAVTDAGTAAPIGGAQVVLLRAADLEVGGGALSGTGGDFRTTVPAGTYHVYLVDPSGDHAPSAYGAPVTVGAGRTVDLAATMAAAHGSITGEVTESGTGTPIPGALILMSSAATGAVESVVTSDGSGGFTAPGLATGDHFMAFIDPTGSHATSFHPGSPDPGNATPVTIAPGGVTNANGSLPARTPTPGGASLTGTITEEGTGDPIEGVAVVALNAADHSVERGAFTSSSGEYHLDVAAGDYNLAFIDATGAHATEYHDDVPFEELADATTVAAPAVTDAALAPTTGAMTGRITDEPTGDPVAGAWVFAVGPTSAIRGAVTAADGSYHLAALTPGRYRALVLDPTGRHLPEHWDDKPTGGTADPVDIFAGTATATDAGLAAADPRPDAWVQRGATGPSSGDDVYNTNGTNQTVTGQAARGRSVTYVVTVQNDAAFADRLILRGTASDTAFRVKYQTSAGGITNSVTAGTHLTPLLAPGERVDIEVTVTVRPDAPSGSSLTGRLSVGSTTDPAIRDKVGFVTRRA